MAKAIRVKSSRRRIDPHAVIAAASGQLSLLSFPIDGAAQFIPLNETIALQPGQSTTLYANGQPGARVTIGAARIQQSGGHSHGGGPAGTAVPSAFTLGNYPQNYPVVVTAPPASGSIQITASFNPGGQASVMMNVAVPGLVELTGGGGIVLTGSTPTHPRNHFGTPALVSKIQQLAQAFHAKFAKPVYVNDMSLQAGGLFDWRDTWAPPHAEHREGRTVDMNSRTMTQTEKDFFRATAASLGFSVVEHGDPLHWHLRI